MNLLNFISQYPDEESCILKLKETREHIGIKCDNCGSDEHKWLERRIEFECKGCGKRISLRNGTIMEGSHLPFKYWFVAIHLLTSTKKSFSALELQRQLGHNRYEPIWQMLHKLREAMGKRDDRYQLTEIIELDDGFFTTITQDKEKGKPLKRGKGSQRKSKVVVLVESKPLDQEKTKTGKLRKVGYLKMIVVDDLKGTTIKGIVNKHIKKGSVIDSDDSNSYNILRELDVEHHAKVIPKEKVNEMLPWVHIAISNAKRLLLDIHHDIDPDYLQNYLNEFCYKFNRRYFGEKLFDRLLAACITYIN